MSTLKLSNIYSSGFSTMLKGTSFVLRRISDNFTVGQYTHFATLSKDYDFDELIENIKQLRDMCAKYMDAGRFGFEMDLSNSKGFNDLLNDWTLIYKTFSEVYAVSDTLPNTLKNRLTYYGIFENTNNSMTLNVGDLSTAFNDSNYYADGIGIQTYGEFNTGYGIYCTEIYA